ncbi:unnamed protein product [Vitrella brassicaformis CCMP3155]|uniref:Uncharacterized protein n=1 Tax=Vitrella brassicaformis (strain CCMP3155) TaxID=1169540 RepID=A0A0G4FAR1_VITBC|nr:unnamed protein product [Vitrella brassicaformis CCMP3155]|eukprot:CEM09723.1 unnamed protein product [Vitrella brassicaformis CCMP3155]
MHRFDASLLPPRRSIKDIKVNAKGQKVFQDKHGRWHDATTGRFARGPAVPNTPKSSAAEGVDFKQLPPELVQKVGDFVPTSASLLALSGADKSNRFEALPLAHLVTALVKMLMVLTASMGFGAMLQIPLPELTQGATATLTAAALIMQMKRLTKRLFVLENAGGNWGKWKPHVWLLYLLNGSAAIILGDATFAAITDEAAYVAMPEAQRQWVLLSTERTIIRQQTGQPFPLVNQFGMIVSWTNIFYRYLPVVLESATALFGTEAFDTANPATLLQPPRSPFSCDDVYRTYTCLMAQQLIMWAVSRHTGLNRIRTWLSTKHPVSSAARRAHELVMGRAANLTDDTNGMGVEHVFDTAQGGGLTRRRYLVLKGGEGIMVILLVSYTGGYSEVAVFTTETGSLTHTRTAVLRTLGPQFGDRVWQEDSESDI